MPALSVAPLKWGADQFRTSHESPQPPGRVDLQVAQHRLGALTGCWRDEGVIGSTLPSVRNSSGVMLIWSIGNECSCLEAIPKDISGDDCLCFVFFAWIQRRF
jgi:hypothetical protein